ncbi:MAG: TraB/GumN family protein [Planctomycetaceae bacterium]|jgi:hypothetical protein|nr:TraB/GumN family protein [Planctomycetaceae bacterium]
MKNTKSIFFVTKILPCVFFLFFAVVVFANDNNAPEKFSDYIRVSKQEGKLHPASIDTPIVKFIDKKKGLEVVLIGAIHIADKKYYDDLNDEFKKYDAVLFELVVSGAARGKNNKLDKEIFANLDKKKKGSYRSMQSGFGDILGLVDQVEHIDYRAKNMIHADLTWEEFMSRVMERGDWFFGLIREFQVAMSGANDELELEGRIIGSLFASNPALSLKRNFARILTSKLMDSSQLLPKEESAIITDRNNAAIKVLKKEIRKGTKKIAIFYGCAHLPEFAESLKKDLKLKKTETTWVVAWDLTKTKSTKK